MTLTEPDIVVHDSTASANEKTALGRAQLIIDSFTPDEPVLSLGSLARRTGLPKSTAHRFVEQMIGLGWLERRHPGYRIGVKLYEMGEMCERRNGLRRAATSHLSALAQRSGRSVYLSVLDGTSVLCLDRASGPTAWSTRAGRRIRFPVLTTAYGRAIVAFESEDEIEHQIATHIDDHGLSLDAEATFRSDLAAVREAGYATGLSRRTGIRFSGIPLRNSGRPVASISVAGDQELPDDRTIAMMHDTAHAIWNEMFPSRGRPLGSH